MSSSPVQNLRFSRETYVTSGAYVVTIPSYADAGALVNVTWCDCGITTSDVLDTNGIGGWSITPPPCAQP